MISHKYKVIFIHIPKCAGTSIESALGHFEGESYLKAQDHRTVRELEPMSIYSYLSKENLKQIHRKRKFLNMEQANPNNLLTVSQRQWNEYYKFTVIRNPWARIESGYRGFMRNKERLDKRGISRNLTFQAFCENFIPNDNLTTPQTFWLKNYKGKIELDKIIKFHQLNNGMMELYHDKGLPLDNLPNMLNYKKDDYRRQYNSVSYDIVNENYKEEIDLFDFNFDDEASGV